MSIGLRFEDINEINFIHGGGAAGLSNFDLDIPGYSLAEAFAAAGHPAYIMDVLGFGRSTQPGITPFPLESLASGVIQRLLQPTSGWRLTMTLTAQSEDAIALFKPS